MTAKSTPKRKPAKRKPAKKAAPRRVDPHAGPEPERQKCDRTTSKGGPCPNWALDGGTICGVHARQSAVGRPTKLEDKVADKICEILKVGGGKELAAAAAGIAKQTLYDWLERGDPEKTAKDNEPFRQFRRDVDQAIAEGKAAALTQIRIAASNDWRAAAWWLERMDPARFGGTLARRDAQPYPGVGDPADPTPDPTIESPVNDDQLGPDGQPL